MPHLSSSMRPCRLGISRSGTPAKSGLTCDHAGPIGRDNRHDYSNSSIEVLPGQSARLAQCGGGDHAMDVSVVLTSAVVGAVVSSLFTVVCSSWNAGRGNENF